MPIPPIRVVIQGIDKFTATVGESMKGLDKLGRKVKNIGRGMTMYATLPILAMGTAAVATTTDFEASMNKVEALTQEVGQPLQNMRNLAKDLGISTAWSATQAADAMAFLGMAGWETNEILAGTPALLDLASASATDLAQTADIASNIMGAFQISAEKTGDVADVLTTITSSANVNLEQLAETMEKAGPIARAAGASLRDTAVAAGFLGNVGIQGSIAGTAMKNMFTQLAAPASEAQKILGALGVQTADSAGNLRGYADILGELSGKMSQLGTAQKLKVMDVIFGKRALAGATALADDINRVNSGFDKLAAKMDKTGGRAREMAETMMKGAPGAMKRFQSAWEGLLIAIGESGLLDAVTMIAEGMAKFFQKLAKLNPALIKIGVIVAGVVAAIGPLLVAVGTLISAWGSVAGAVASAGGVIALVTNPIVLAIAGIAALIGFLKLAGLKWQEIWRFMLIPLTPFVAAVEWITKRWSRLVPFFKLLFLVVGGLFKVFAKAMGIILKPLLWILDRMIEDIGALLDVGLGLLEKLAGRFMPEDIQKKIGLGEPVGGGAALGDLALAGGVPGAPGVSGTVDVRFQNAPAGLEVERTSGEVGLTVERGMTLPEAGI